MTPSGEHRLWIDVLIYILGLNGNVCSQVYKVVSSRIMCFYRMKTKADLLVCHLDSSEHPNADAEKCKKQEKYCKSQRTLVRRRESSRLRWR